MLDVIILIGVVAIIALLVFDDHRFEGPDDEDN